MRSNDEAVYILDPLDDKWTIKVDPVPLPRKGVWTPDCVSPCRRPFSFILSLSNIIYLIRSERGRQHTSRTKEASSTARKARTEESQSQSCE